MKLNINGQGNYIYSTCTHMYRQFGSLLYHKLFVNVALAAVAVALY